MIGSFRLDQGLVLLLDIERLVPDAALAAADGLEGESQ
jgi:chemotaxis signal transduction protein